MNISKYLVLGLAALAFSSCEKDDPTFANYVPGKDTPDTPDTPSVVTPPSGAELADVKVDKNITYQTIRGFGASDCWAPQYIGETWTNVRDEIATLLFDQSASGAKTAGIGLSMWRVNLGAGSLEQGADSNIGDAGRRAGCFHTYDADSKTFSEDIDWTKCQGLQYWMKKAQEMGVESIVFFSNSPLAQYTYNKKTYSGRGAKNSNLRPNNYAKFAKYLAEVAAHFKTNGYNITHISPFNEPQYAWGADNGNAGQEGSGWSVKQQAQLVRELDAALTEKGVDVNILPGEAANWKELYESDRILENYFTPGGENYIGDLAHVKNNQVCAHSYWTDGDWNTLTSVRTNVANAAKQVNAEVWQSEWSMLTDNWDTDMFPGYTDATDMDQAMQLSRVINTDLVYGNVSSWCYWTSMDAGTAEHKNRFLLIRLLPDSGDYTEGTGSYEVTPNLWVLGNYSLCIRPDFVRIDNKLANGSQHFFGSSYLSPDNTRIVSVYTNNTDKTYYLPQDEFEGRDQVQSIKTYTTSATQQMEPGTVRVKDFVTIPPRSVITVVYDL